MNDKETKSIFASKTFWGVMVSALAAFLPRLGVKLAPGSLAEMANQAAILVGAALAIYGRITATKNIKTL